MKKQNNNIFCDEISGKEDCDYIMEFSPHRLSVIPVEEDSDSFFFADEDEIIAVR